MVAPTAAMVCEPLVGRLPDQPADAVQAEALADDHVITVLPPGATVLGLALI